MLLGIAVILLLMFLCDVAKLVLILMTNTG